MDDDEGGLQTVADRHPFVLHPHRTVVTLSLPVLLSLVAEPLTGIADTAFVARLGSAPMTGLGVAAVLLSSVFWVFNFLGIGTQTEVARALGANDHVHAEQVTGLATIMGGLIGVLLALLMWPWLALVAAAMGATDAIQESAVDYLRIRLLGGPGVLVTIAAFGALRGRQDMRTPLWIAGGTNALNIVLDAVLIFGAGPIPALGIVGAAWASTVSHWLGAVWAVRAVRVGIGLRAPGSWRNGLALLVVGRDLFVRTGSLVIFALMTTRVATRIGAEAGAAHQAIRQIWLFTAFLLDSYAVTAQSLVSYFLGARRVALARRVAVVMCWWGFGTGCLLSLIMFLGEHAVARLLVPPVAFALFFPAWIPATAAQPLNALSFVTDGIHWGTGDYRYLRNAMLVSSGIGILALLTIDPTEPGALVRVWTITAGWITVRAVFNLIRIWSGVGRSPLRAGLGGQGSGFGSRPSNDD